MSASPLSASDREHVRSIAARLACVPADAAAGEGRAAPTWLIHELRDLLHGAHALGYRPAQNDEGHWGLHERSTTLPQTFFDTYHAAASRLTTPFHFDPLHPEARQRNRVRTLVELCDAHPDHDHPCVVHSTWDAVGIRSWDQIRVLVCEGDTLLAWVGAIGPERFGARERSLLGALTRPLARYLGAERRLRDAGLARAGLGAALEAMGAPSFVVTSRGRVLHANRAGAHLADGWGRSAPERLRAAVRCPGDGDYVLRIADGAAPEAFLVVLRGASSALDTRVAALTAAWGLSPREAGVLSRLARGDSNKELAAALRAAEVTVERHVTSLLRKSRCDSRARLIARFWSSGA
jgi:DNA-binding CsgD family transcriptional regulator/PAS domain-containing protein